MVDILFVANSNLLRVDGLKDESSGGYINDADVEVTLKDANGVEVVGASWPIAASYITGSNGRYEAVLPHGLSLAVAALYSAEIVATKGASVANWTATPQALTRGT